jgi:hypothetical protein
LYSLILGGHVDTPKGLLLNSAISALTAGTVSGVGVALKGGNFWSGARVIPEPVIVGQVEKEIIKEGGEKTLEWVDEFAGRKAGDIAKSGLNETKLLSQFTSTTLDDAASLTLRQKGSHIFEGTLHPKPYLDEIANTMGGRRNLLTSALKQGNGRFPTLGKFELPFSVGGRSLIMRGFVNNGKPMINTMFDPLMPIR